MSEHGMARLSRGPVQFSQRCFLMVLPVKVVIVFLATQLLAFQRALSCSYVARCHQHRLSCASFHHACLSYRACFSWYLTPQSRFLRMP